MFIWGKGHKTIELPQSVNLYCSECGSSSDHHASVDYDYDHIFWLFKGSKNHRTTTVCKNCQHPKTLVGVMEKELFQKLGGNPIPFMDRYGGHVFLIVIVAYIAFAMSSPCTINPNSQICLDSQQVAD